MSWPDGLLMRRWLHSGFDRWLARRIPPTRAVVLNQRRIFIFPSRAGFLFLALLATMLATAINYQNNSVYALTFVLAGLFVVAILGGFANLAGLGVEQAGAVAPFAGEHATFRVRLRSGDRRQHIAVAVGWPEYSMASADLVANRCEELEIYLPAPRRGVLRAPRLLIESRYPLGLVRVWSWLDLDFETVVYPAPGRVRELPFASGRGSPVAGRDVDSADELSNVRPWRSTDPPRRVLWKAYAREQPLMTMEYAEGSLDEQWLDFDRVVGHAQESALSVLCASALQLAQRPGRFGLMLPDTSVSPGQGSEHLQRVLDALGRFRAEHYSP